MPSFRDGNGMVWKWDPTSGTMVPATDHDQRPDIGHASGGDNDLFDPFTHTEQSSSPTTEGYMASVHVATPDRPGQDELTPDLTSEELEELYAEEHDRRSEEDRRAEPRDTPDRRKTSNEWAPPGKVKCPNCENVTSNPSCPVCAKDLTPEWNQTAEKNGEFFGIHPPFDPRNEFISDPERVPKRNQLKTDDSFPSMNLSHFTPLSSVKHGSLFQWL